MTYGIQVMSSLDLNFVLFGKDDAYARAVSARHRSLLHFLCAGYLRSHYLIVSDPMKPSLLTARFDPKNIMQEMFPGTELCRRINPDEAIVIGAALEASRSVDMTDIVPRPLSIGEPMILFPDDIGESLKASQSETLWRPLSQRLSEGLSVRHSLKASQPETL